MALLSWDYSDKNTPDGRQGCAQADQPPEEKTGFPFFPLPPKSWTTLDEPLIPKVLSLFRYEIKKERLSAS